MAINDNSYASFRYSDAKDVLFQFSPDPAALLGTSCDKADAERIIACVNAYRGIPTDRLSTVIAIGLMEIKNLREFNYICPNWVREALEMRK